MALTIIFLSISMKHINVSGKKYMVQFLPYQTEQKINLMKFTINTSIVQKNCPSIFNLQQLSAIKLGITVVLHQYQNISNDRIWPNAVCKKNTQV